MAKRMIDKMENHFLVCGFGWVGRGAAEELQRAGVPSLELDRSEDRVETLRMPASPGRAALIGALGSTPITSS